MIATYQDEILVEERQDTPNVSNITGSEESQKPKTMEKVAEMDFLLQADGVFSKQTMVCFVHVNVKSKLLHMNRMLDEQRYR